MNTNPAAKRILCFGDSNTWARNGESTQRYPADVRWTSLLQEKLGNDYEIIEEGLRSRTTDLEDDDPSFPGRNGLAYLRPCIESHNPLDMVILWLGTNDLKSKFDRTPDEVGHAIQKLITVIQEHAKNLQNEQSTILLISPPIIVETHLGSGFQFDGAGKKSIELGKIFQEIAAKHSCEFLDLAPIAQPGAFDGVHLEPESHLLVAEALFQITKHKVFS